MLVDGICHTRYCIEELASSAGVVVLECFGVDSCTERRAAPGDNQRPITAGAHGGLNFNDGIEIQGILRLILQR